MAREARRGVPPSSYHTILNKPLYAENGWTFACRTFFNVAFNNKTENIYFLGLCPLALNHVTSELSVEELLQVFDTNIIKLFSTVYLW